MKYYLIVAERISDEPLAELGGRTPLEAAKTPVLDELARRGQTGMVRFSPANLEPSSETASMAMLGYDPLSMYTGLAPIEAAAYGVAQDDREIIFRCDLTTVVDHTLIDASSGNIGDREAGLLFSELVARFGSDRFRFERGHGYKNFLVVRDPELTEELDGIECMPPYRALGESIAKRGLRGRAGKMLMDLARETSSFLETHEINRVRIDLGENPANFVWMWGQGRRPKLAPFEKERGIRGTLQSTADFARGLGVLTGLASYDPAHEAATELVWVYAGTGELSRAAYDLKAKIKRIEALDGLIETFLNHAKDQDARVCVTTDLAESIEKKSVFAGQVPFLMSGAGIAPTGCEAFAEKNCVRSERVLEASDFLKEFLK